MKRNIIIASLTIIMSILSFFNSNSQGYDALWEKVQELKHKDMPRKVLDETQKIYDKAQREKNFPHLAKAWITIVETKCDIDPDSFKIENFPPLPHKGAVQDAVWHAIMGSAYMAMTDSYIRDFDDETQTQYRATAREHFTLALSDKAALAKASATSYLPLVTQGDDSRLYSHDMLSLLTRFVLEHDSQPASKEAELLADIAAYYRQHGTREAYTLIQLQYLIKQNQHEDYNKRLLGKDYREALRQLVEETKDLDAGADVAKAYCETFSNDDELLAFARWAQQQYKDAYCAPYFTNIDNEKQKISLSIRALSEPAPAPRREEYSAPAEPDEPEEDALVYEVSSDGVATGEIPEEPVNE